jgi:hypothetical protein
LAAYAGLLPSALSNWLPRKRVRRGPPDDSGRSALAAERERPAGGGASLERTRLWAQIPCSYGKIQGIARFCRLFGLDPQCVNAGIPRLSRSNSLRSRTGNFWDPRRETFGAIRQFSRRSGKNLPVTLGPINRPRRERRSGRDSFILGCCSGWELRWTSVELAISDFKLVAQCFESEATRDH